MLGNNGSVHPNTQFAQVSKSWQDRAAASSEYNPVTQSSTNSPEQLVATQFSDTHLAKLPAADLQAELARVQANKITTLKEIPL